MPMPPSKHSLGQMLSDDQHARLLAVGDPGVQHDLAANIAKADLRAVGDAEARGIVGMHQHRRPPFAPLAGAPSR